METIAVLAGVLLIGAVAAMPFAMGGAYLVTRGPSALSDLVGGWKPMGWPVGVQEDDDFHWRWDGKPVESPDSSGGDAAADGGALDSELSSIATELQDGGQPVRVQRLDRRVMLRR
jgi:hypothetical protein